MLSEILRSSDIFSFLNGSQSTRSTTEVGNSLSESKVFNISYETTEKAGPLLPHITLRLC